MKIFDKIKQNVAVSVLRNDRKCKYILLFHQRNWAQQVFETVYIRLAIQYKSNRGTVIFKFTKQPFTSLTNKKEGNKLFS